jgi:hypothetical protein
MAKKRPSGHQQRKLAAAKRETARRAKAGYLEKYAALGTPPKDPTRGLIYAQQAMLVALHEVMNDATIGAELKWKLIANLGSKVGMTYAKTLQQGKLDDLARALLPSDEDGEEHEQETIDPEKWHRARRIRASEPGPVPGPGAHPPETHDGGVAPSGGRPVGPAKGPVH